MPLPVILLLAASARADEDKQLLENIRESVKNALQAEGIKEFTLAAQSAPVRVTTRSVNNGEKMLCVRAVVTYKLRYDPRQPANKKLDGQRDLVLIFRNPTSVRSLIDSEVMRTLAKNHNDQDTLQWLSDTDGLKAAAGR